MAHLCDEEIERFLADRAAPWEQQRVVRHLLAGCGICSRKLLEWTPDRLLDEAQERRRGRASRDPLRDRTVAAALDQDSRWRPDDKKLERSLELLGTHPEAYDGLTSRQAETLHGPDLVEALLQKSWDLRFRDPQGMRWLAYNALKTAESLRAEEHIPAALLDLQARTWGELANAYRVSDQFDEAEAAMAKARPLLRRGSGDPGSLARIAQFEVALRQDQGRLAEAGDLLKKIYLLYGKIGDAHLVGHTLISRGINEFEAGRPQQAVQCLQKGLTLVDPDRDQRTFAAGQVNIVTILAACGEHREAGQLLLKNGLRRAFSGDPLSLLKIRWAEGKIQHHLGNYSKSVRALTEVRAEFEDAGQNSTAATVGLDLLPVLWKQGHHDLARRTALETYSTLRSLGNKSRAAKVRQYLR